ncbi:hypothetical protein [Lacrimispora sphenoides]|uniref:Methyl-accepting chemotaxis protein n=1 Tax=Lacrimispora sphenoides JCM 1415 TaxID=1297793 RepID=A0ABY1CCS7_9FIRM|nr:hypothetical protein [Lacrimispora sphenoides]SET94020.1 methyl-accepting chemotaxis protein [[Clostridium] sphenoides JCM 1415]SUY52542.1 methyl-accepting chemotaxis sensory transducer with Cache sensor [Lacrimispora sphenoides]
MESVEDTSRKETNAINQVYYSITQISAVVQSDTSTAKQSSTSSEEISSKANLLREEVKNLKLLIVNKKAIQQTFVHFPG